MDGANVGTATYTDPIDLSGSANNFIGSSTGQWFWNGQIDEVEVFDRALSLSVKSKKSTTLKAAVNARASRRRMG